MSLLSQESKRSCLHYHRLSSQSPPLQRASNKWLDGPDVAADASCAAIALTHPGIMRAWRGQDDAVNDKTTCRKITSCSRDYRWRHTLYLGNVGELDGWKWLVSHAKQTKEARPARPLSQTCTLECMSCLCALRCGLCSDGYVGLG